MYNNMYRNPYFNSQMNLEQINNQIRDLENMKNQYQNMPQNNFPQGGITQNFQLAPTSNTGAIRYVEDTEEVEKTLVFNDTLFVNKSYTQLWVKNTLGEIKTYELSEIIVLDPKDEEIAYLRAKISMLESEKKDETTITNANDNATTKTKKPTNVSTNK